MNESTESNPGADPADIERQLWQFVNRPDFRPSKPRYIGERLDFDADQRAELRRAVKRLVKQGRLEWGPRHLIQLPGGTPATKAARRPPKRVHVDAGTPPRKAPRDAPRDESHPPARARKDEVTGIYRKTAAGYGFVNPDGSPAGDRSQDLFVPIGQSLDAVDRDRVRVRVRRGRSGARLRLTGEVIEVVERKRHRFVGTLVRQGRRDLVEVDGGVFSRPVPVGDASAANARPGDTVVIEVVRFPSADVAGEAVIAELLGPRGQPGVDTLTIIHQFGLPGEFPPEVVDDARRQTEKFTEAIPENRVDLTGETIITIDPVTARDFDDAISLVSQPGGNWRLGVHIADVSHFVPPGTALDDEALARGNSVYLPDRVIPMLPETISNGLASLQPGRVRYTMSVFLTVDATGRVLAAEWCRGAIRSAWRFNYGEIDEYLAADQPWREKLPADVFRLVRDMHSLAMTMRKRRMDRGAIDLVLPEVAIDLDENGHVSGAHVELNTESHQLIEEFMLSANEAVAQKLVDLAHLPLRRIHERPSERRLKELTEFIRHLGIECGDLQDRFEIRRVVELARNLPIRPAVHMSVLRSMQKAVYSPKDEGHYALGSDAYCHFTSPIRRYPDLVIHRMVGAILDGKNPRADFDYLARTGQQCSETEQRAEQAERELIKLKLINYLAQRIGTEMPAVITGVESWGVFVQGTELPAEGLVPVNRLPLDQYTHDPQARTMMGRQKDNQFRLGDLVRVRVEVADPNRRELTFSLVTASEGSTSSSQPRRAGQFGNRKPPAPEAGRNAGIQPRSGLAGGPKNGPARRNRP